MSDYLNLIHYGVGPAMKGTTVRIDGFPGPVLTSHYVSLRALAFSGTVLIEGSLVNSPGDDDWYPLKSLTDADFAFTDTPPTGMKTIITSFQTRTVWLRVSCPVVNYGRIDRIIIRSMQGEPAIVPA